MTGVDRPQGASLGRALIVAALTAFGGGALGQTPGPAAAPAAAASGPPLMLDQPAVASPQGAAAADKPADAARPAPAATCSSLSEQAMSIDLQAASLQAKRADPAVLATMFDESIALWGQAAKLCQGRRQAHAESNVKDMQRARRAIDEVLDAGPKCASTQHDARTVQDLAVQASGERRWLDATRLYNRAAQMWELAVERCSGSLRQTALQRKGQAETDAHNSEHCAPMFDRARSRTQHLRTQSVESSPAGRQRALQIAETLWREAMANCKGPALDVATSNAQALARERGTPWVSTIEPDDRPVAAAAAASAAVPVPAAASAAPPSPAAPPPAAAQSSVVGALPAAAAAAPAAASATGPRDFDIVLGGGARLVGQFSFNPAGKTYTGAGKMFFANGDRYDGAVVDSLQHGQGHFRWASGQQYDGMWVHAVPQGRGRMHFVNGDQYEGDFVAGVPEGSGKMVYGSADSYTGQFKGGLPHGKGLYRWINGQRYDGTWVSGVASGSGEITFSDGRHYVGQIERGVPHGRGALKFVSGDIYEGELVDGLPEGTGHYRWQNGDEYQGQWKAGKRNGRGRFVWHNGDRWEGQFQADLQTADGELIRKTP